MPNPASYPMDSRPAGYRGGVAEMLSRIRGANRRHQVEAAVRAGRLHEVPECLLGEKAPEGYQRFVEAIDPRSMGGEYLPRLRPNEVEVARVEMPTTTTGDVISVRAREVKGGYRYAVVDEYQSHYRCSPGRTKRPLTLGQLIRLIDTAYRCDEGMDYEEQMWAGMFAARAWNLKEGGGDPEDYRDFYRVTSPFYPDLERWYDEVADEWVSATKRDQAER